MRKVTAFYGHTPYGDCLPVILGVDDEGVIRKIDDSYIAYGDDICADIAMLVRVPDLPVPAFPFSNIYPDIEKAHVACVAHYEAMRDGAECGLDELHRAKEERLALNGSDQR